VLRTRKEVTPLVCPEKGHKLPTKVLIPNFCGSSNYWKYTKRLGDERRCYEKGTDKASGYSTQLN
jgi:hypothetical protein